MVKVGFICEGATEKLVVASTNFQRLLASLQIECVFPIIDAEGNGNLLPKNIEAFRTILASHGAKKIIILTDLDEDRCITVTKDRITGRPDQIIIVAVKKIEAWFLADALILSQLLKKNIVFEFPERETDPFQTIRSLMMQHTGRGIPSKTLLAKKLIDDGFSLEQAAHHAHCFSAKYLLQKLHSLHLA